MNKHNIGDVVYIAIGCEDLHRGKIIDITKPEGYTYDLYIIELPTYAGPLLEVRDYMTVSDNEDGPLNFLKDIFEKT